MKKVGYGDFPGAPVIKTPPSNVVSVDSIPGWGNRSHMLQDVAKIFFEVPKKKKRKKVGYELGHAVYSLQ